MTYMLFTASRLQKLKALKIINKKKCMKDQKVHQQHKLSKNDLYDEPRVYDFFYITLDVIAFSTFVITAVTFTRYKWVSSQVQVVHSDGM